MNKKMVAPIVITVFVILYFVIYFGVFVFIVDSWLWRILFAIIPVGMSGLMIHVCRQRIKEIRSKEEDDLSQY